MLFDTLFQIQERQLLHEVRTMATHTRCKFAKEFDLKTTATEDKAYGAAKMTANMRLQFRITLSTGETDATTWSLADSERVTNLLESELCGITSNEHERFNRDFSICMIQFEAWWDTMESQVHQKTIEQRLKHCGYPKMHLVSHISESIRRMGSAVNFTNHIS
jgi:hypothetical protein